MTVELTEIEADELANAADLYMENALEFRDKYKRGTAAWYWGDGEAGFWRKIAVKMGHKYEEAEQ